MVTYDQYQKSLGRLQSLRERLGRLEAEVAGMPLMTAHGPTDVAALERVSPLKAMLTQRTQTLTEALPRISLPGNVPWAPQGVNKALEPEEPKDFGALARNAGRAIVGLGVGTAELGRKLFTPSLRDKLDAFDEIEAMLPNVRGNVRQSLGEVLGPIYDAIAAPLGDKEAAQRLGQSGGVAPAASALMLLGPKASGRLAKWNKIREVVRGAKQIPRPVEAVPIESEAVIPGRGMAAAEVLGEKAGQRAAEIDTRLTGMEQAPASKGYADLLAPEKVVEPPPVAPVKSVAMNLQLPPIVSEVIATAGKSMEELRGRISDVKAGPIVGNFETVDFKLDGKPYRGSLKGRNRDVVVGAGSPEANASIALRTLLDEDAQPLKPAPLGAQVMREAKGGKLAIEATKAAGGKAKPVEPTAPEVPISNPLERATDVTKDRLDEVRNTSSFGEKVRPSWTKKPIDAELTPSEQSVLDRVGTSANLGFVSKALLYSDFVRRLPVLERRALWSLLDRGRLSLEKVSTPSGQFERIVPKTMEAAKPAPLGAQALREAGGGKAAVKAAEPVPVKPEPIPESHWESLVRNYQEKPPLAKPEGMNESTYLRMKAKDLRRSAGQFFGQKGRSLIREAQTLEIRADELEFVKSGPGIVEMHAGITPGTVSRGLEALGNTKIVDELKQIFAPASRGPEAKAASLGLREMGAARERQTAIAMRALKDASKHFDSQPKEVGFDFVDRIESGQKQADLRLQGFADVVRDALDTRAKELVDLGALKDFNENYFPRAAKLGPKEPMPAGAVGRRPFLGPKSFLKHRTFTTYKEFRDAGYVMPSENPIDVLMTKVGEMDKFIYAKRNLAEAKQVGRVEFVSVFDKPPEGLVRIEDPAFSVYGPPHIGLKEAYDQAIFDGLNAVAKNLNIPHTRKTSIGGSRRWGYAKGPPSSDIVTKFSGPESVIAHEIGHQLDWKYGLKDKLVSHSDFKEELRALADLRAGGSETISPSFKRYIRKGEEKMAAMLEAYIHAPEAFRRAAPKTFAYFDSFIRSHEELRPLSEIRPGLELGVGTTQKGVGGLILKGNYYAPEPVARVYNNLLRPGLAGRSSAYDAYIGAGNLLNQAQLSMSGFHGGFTSVESIISKTALGFNKLAHGDVVGFAKALAQTPTAPITNVMKGHRLIKEYFGPGSQGGEVGKIVEGLIAGGGRAEMPAIYATRFNEAFSRAIRRGEYWKAAPRAIPAFIEMAAKPVMQWLVPRQKLGIFSDLLEMERKHNPGMTHEQLRVVSAKIWDSVDNRLGQMVYDNLFINRTAKDLAHASIRSVGWNLGTIREVVGGAGDIGKQALNVMQGKKPEMTYRMAYVVALPTVVGLMGAITQYLMTGKGPQEMKDYFFPKTGDTDQNGDPARVSLPSYMKDVYHYYYDPVRTVKAKLHPLVGTIADMLDNQDYWGTEIRHPGDPALQQGLDLAGYALRQVEPIAFRNIERQVGMEGKIGAKALLPMIGVTPAPRTVNESPAERVAYEAMRESLPRGARTKVAAEESRMKGKIRTEMRAGASSTLESALLAGKLSRGDVRGLNRSIKESPIVRMTSGLPLLKAIVVWDKATDAEKRELTPIIWRKIANVRRMGSPEDRRVFQADMDRITLEIRAIK